jgi:hypothetical protein
MVMNVVRGCNGQLGQFRVVICGSVKFSYEKEKKCWLSSPSRVGLDEVGFDFDIGGSELI